MQRLDHAMIFLMIAGSVSSILLVGLEAGALRSALVAMTWAVAVVGATQKLVAREHDERISVPAQIALGFLAVPAIPAFVTRFPGEPAILLGVGALSFLLGAICFVTRSPVLWPRVFSFHEVFHVCTVVGSGALGAMFVRYLL